MEKVERKDRINVVKRNKERNVKDKWNRKEDRAGRKRNNKEKYNN